MSTGSKPQQSGSSTLEHEAYLALQLLATQLRDESEGLLKAAGLSITQFNVLRILRGSGKQGLTCGDIGTRLINKDPDVTRLLDRMEKQGLVERARSEQDRRVVLTRISDKGLNVVGQLDTPLEHLHHRQFGHLGVQRLQQLLVLLAQAGAPGSPPESI